MSEVLCVRYLSRADALAAGAEDFRAAIADVRAVLTLLNRGEARMIAESALALAGGAEDAQIYALPAAVGPPFDAVGVKWTAHRSLGMDDGPRILSLTLINARATGRPIGIVESAALTAMRTAAVSAVAIAVASPRAPRRVALLGAGIQARAHLRMLAAIHPELAEVALWNRTPANLDALIAASPPLPWHVRRCATVAAATEAADVVLACTAAATPILGPEIARGGRLIAQIGYHEASFELIDACDNVVVDAWGEFRLASAKSLFRMHRAGRFPAERVTIELARALVEGWRPPPDACVYFNSFGLNVFDVALAARILRSAEQHGLGTVLPLL